MREHVVRAAQRTTNMTFADRKRTFRHDATALANTKVIAVRPPSHTSDSIVDTSVTTTEHEASDIKGPLGLNLLYAPADPLVNFVFVHGLGGGSRKTWSKTSSIKDYWPQAWLPKDPAFSNVRIYSFGYNSDWGRGKSNCLNIHHFGKSLLGAMSICLDLKNGCTPIVLIGHSMGGLVIKKAYNIAMREPTYEDLAKRVKTIYFLATPHSGSDSAKLLSGILHVASLSRDFVGELKRNSGTIQGISDEFRNYSADLDLWSFYETSKLSMKLFSQMIVTPDSAVLDVPGEKQMPMNADHRSICKFDSISDPNYRIVRNALETTVAEITKGGRTTEQQLLRGHVKELESYLRISDSVEIELDAVNDARIPETCKWFAQRIAYQKWKDCKADAPSVMWVAGMPAAGKSTLAGYIVDDLRQANAGCSFFFFKHGDESKSRLVDCLRSLAFQMACNHSSIRTKMLEMQSEDVTIRSDNERTIWRKLFLSGVFQTKFPPHYWIIDALDECVNSGNLFDLIFDSLDASIPLRILITSRKTGELDKSFQRLGVGGYQLEQLSVSDTFLDIKLLIQIKAKRFNVNGDNDREHLVERILQKSNGSFLWAVLVSNMLSDCHTKEQIDRILDGIPKGMESLYQRTLDTMSLNAHGRKLTSAILVWVVCAIRPLSLAELADAVQLDIGETPLSMEKTVVALCGQLVIVDKLGRVQVVHETAREFLSSANLGSEFAIKPTQAHTQIARACLLYLTGEEMKPPRSGRRQSTIATTRSDFAFYACAYFSYHLSKADACSDELFSLVDKFLKLNVLCWIEVIAKTKNLLLVIQVAKHLRSYLAACTPDHSTKKREVSHIKGWTIDLVRIAAKFADALILCPSAIYSLILPFCPVSSSIYKTANNGRRLTIMGVSNLLWDDRMFCINFPDGQTSALCAGADFMAVGLITGSVHLYHAASYQAYKSIDHGEAVKFLQFKPKSNLMASCGIRNIRIWDVRSGQIVHSFQAAQRPIKLVFDQDLLLVASQQNSLTTWDLEHDGARRPDRIWNDSLEQTNAQLRRPPCAIAISVTHQMLAVAYSGKPIILWDLAENTYFGNCGRKLPSGETSTHVISTLVFNPNMNVGLLAASYLDGQLSLLDPFNDQEITSFRAGCHTLASSPDGRLLAGAAGSGMIQVYEFDTLRLLYRVKSSNFYIKQLFFSADGLQFADIRGSQCNVWEPAILLRDIIGDNSSVDSSTSVAEVISSDSNVRISALALHQNAGVAFCGKENGLISVYCLRRGVEMKTLYSHKTLVRTIVWCRLIDVIISADASNNVYAWKLKVDKHQGWLIDQQLFHCRLDCGNSINRVLPGEIAGKLVFSTRESSHFWTLEGQEREVRLEKPGMRKWIQHPQSPSQMICIDGECARIYAWDDWSEIACVSLDVDMEYLQLKRILPFMIDREPQMLLELSELGGSLNTQKIYVIDEAVFEIANSTNLVKEQPPDNTSVQDQPREVTEGSPYPRSQADFLASQISHIIGISDNGKLVFLDMNSWVCSVNLGNMREYTNTFSYSRHFFIPFDWFSGTRDIICALNKRDVILVRNNDVAIVKGGLEYVEDVNVDIETAFLKRRRRLGIGGTEAEEFDLRVYPSQCGHEDLGSIIAQYGRN